MSCNAETVDPPRYTPPVSTTGCCVGICESTEWKWFLVCFALYRINVSNPRLSAVILHVQATYGLLRAE